MPAIRSIVSHMQELVDKLNQLDPQTKETIVKIALVAAALVAAFMHLWKTNENFNNNILGIWEQIKSTFSNLTQGITDRINELGFNFESFTDMLKRTFIVTL